MVLHQGNTSLDQCPDGGGWVGCVAGAAGAAVAGGETIAGATVAVAGAGAGSGCPTLATSSGWMIGGHSAATAGSMFQRRYLVLSTWKRR
jgi:hypothetical protein